MLAGVTGLMHGIAFNSLINGCIYQSNRHHYGYCVVEIVQSVALAGGMAWASGLRLYAVILTAGLLGRFGYLKLPEDLQIIQNPWILGLAGALFMIEFLADKIPAVDSVWDSIQAFIRIPAGALLAALALG